MAKRSRPPPQAPRTRMANKGMDVRYVYGLDACHTDVALVLEQRVPALIWAMTPWKEKLAAKKSA